MVGCVEVKDHGGTEYIASYYRPYAVKILITDFKHDSPIEHWFNDLFAASSILVPEFELATKTFLPISIEINQHDKPTFEPTIKIHIAISMHVKGPARWIYLVSGPGKVGIWQEGFHACDLRQKS